jgi:hypothetical protein
MKDLNGIYNDMYNLLYNLGVFKNFDKVGFEVQVN